MANTGTGETIQQKIQQLQEQFYRIIKKKRFLHRAKGGMCNTYYTAFTN